MFWIATGFLAAELVAPVIGGVAAFAWFVAGLWFGWSCGAEPMWDERISAVPIPRAA